MVLPPMMDLGGLKSGAAIRQPFHSCAARWIEPHGLRCGATAWLVCPQFEAALRLIGNGPEPPDHFPLIFATLSWPPVNVNANAHFKFFELNRDLFHLSAVVAEVARSCNRRLPRNSRVL